MNLTVQEFQMELVFILFFIMTLVFMVKIFEVLKDIAESLRMLANNPKSIDEARKVRLQTNKISKVSK